MKKYENSERSRDHVIKIQNPDYEKTMVARAYCNPAYEWVEDWGFFELFEKILWQHCHVIVT